MFLMNTKSITRWLVMTEFEMLINLIGLFCTTIFISLKLDFDFEFNWFQVMLPMFLADCLQAYFCLIVFLRQFYEFQAKSAVFRLIIASMFLTFRFLFKLFIYLMIDEVLNEKKIFKFQFASFPLFFHLIFLMFRSCGLKKHQVLS
jgi:ribonuclease P/MRP protein subunit RPP20